MAQTLLALAIVVVAARLVGGGAVRLGQPRVVGEILAGVLIGPSALGLLGGVFATERLFPPPTRAALVVIGQLGLLLYMLLVGLGFDPASLIGRVRAVTVVAVAIVAIPVGAGFAILPVMRNEQFWAGGSSLAFALFLGAMLSVSAFPVLVRILEERSLHQSSFGVLAIASAAVVTVLMFVVTALAREVAEGGTTLDLLLVPVRSAIYLVIMFAVVRPVLARLGPRIVALAPTGVLAVAMVVVLLSGWLAVEAGPGVIVGGFIAGLVLPGREVLAPLLNARLGDLVGAILLPVFLATSGLATNLTLLTLASLAGLAVFLVVAVISKWWVGAGVARLVGVERAEANALGILMNCRGLLVLVVALAALETEVITAQMQVGAVLVALVTTAMTGPLFARALAPRRAERSLSRRG